MIRIRHYAYRTEQTYLGWLSQYGAFVQKRQLPWDAPDSARAFLGELALERGVAASTQNQAFSALLFLLREVLGQDTASLNSVRARRGPHLPVVLTEKEVALVLAEVEGTTGLMLRLIYGSGLRVSECTRLRVKDLDFDQGLVTVRASKGDKDRTTLLPSCLVAALKAHLERVKALHDRELAAGHGDVELLSVGGLRPRTLVPGEFCSQISVDRHARDPRDCRPCGRLYFRAGSASYSISNCGLLGPSRDS